MGSMEDQSEQMKQIRNKVLDYAQEFRYVLIANPNESFFQKEESMSTGSLGRLEEVFYDMAKGLTPFNERTYKNHQTDSITYVANVVDRDFKIHREPFNFNWKIKDSTKQILGFEAKKAEGVYHYPVTQNDIEVTAWFLPGLPLPTGPDVFRGVPGLIAEIRTQKAVVRAKEIEKVDETAMKRIGTQDSMTKKEFDGELAGVRQRLFGD